MARDTSFLSVMRIQFYFRRQSPKTWDLIGLLNWNNYLPCYLSIFAAKDGNGSDLGQGNIQGARAGNRPLKNKV